MKKPPSEHSRPGHLFPSAAEDLRNAKADITEGVAQQQLLSTSYRLAFDDIDFLLREELRGVRLQLELNKPDFVLKEHGIERTVVIFGSARTPTPEQVAIIEQELDLQLAMAPENPGLKQQQLVLERQRRHSRYYVEARRLAALITAESQCESCPRLHVVTGGGPGIMEAANKGAEDVGGESIGLNIVLPHEQAPNPHITPQFCFQFHYFAIRKMHFLLRARALVVFPGGFGTLDELFETLTLVQTGKIKPLPILIFGKEYWDGLLNFPYMVEQGVISADDLDSFCYVESAEEAWEIIRDSLVGEE
jgi:hypothetical protein